MSRTFVAEYFGDCDDCGGQLKGTEVVFNASDELVHVNCPPSPLDVARPVCPRCFLELPVSGECGSCG